MDVPSEFAGVDVIRGAGEGGGWGGEGLQRELKLCTRQVFIVLPV
jgi:hypothetical protein